MHISKLIQKRNTALHLAAKYSHQTIAKLLVQAGADLNPKNRVCCMQCLQKTV